MFLPAGRKAVAGKGHRLYGWHVTDDARDDLPTLCAWLGGVDDHPLRWFFRSRRPEPSLAEVVHAWWQDPHLVTMDETLSILDSAGPLGLSTKRRDFRAARGTGQPAMERFAPLRNELVVASLLAEQGVPFRFNTKAGPDLLIGDGISPVCAIEVGSCNPESLTELWRAVTDALQERGMSRSVDITTDPVPPVAISAEVRESVVRQFAPLDGGPGVTGLRFEASPGRPQDGIPATWVNIRIGDGRQRTMSPYLSPHMSVLAHRVARDVLREKRKVRQSLIVPTVLIVDVSHSDQPDIRYWDKTFASFWKETDQFLALGAMVASSVSRRTPDMRFSVNPFADKAALNSACEYLQEVPSMGDLVTQAAVVAR